MRREKFSSRLGFILISAGCAIGLGNVWRFPYITGQFGGAAFVLIYLVFLVILGLPIMVMELSVGRASQKSAASSFRILEPKKTKWHLEGYAAMLGNYMLMLFYTVVGGWMINYFVKMAKGTFVGLDPEGVGRVFQDMLAAPGEQILWMMAAIIIGFGVCSFGLKNGVEKITKIMMVLLLCIMGALCVRSATLPGGVEGLKFFLLPDFKRLADQGIGKALYAAMGQAFFTLSVGIGAIAIFGSYINKKRRLTGEAVTITALDTMVALMSGLIIFPACFAFNVDQAQGPGLVFVTLPNVFNQMPGGRIWGALFFVFLSFAALSTIIAVFENIISFAIDLWGWSRKKAVIVNGILVAVLSLPCVLGFNLLSSFQPLGDGSTIQDLEDFIVSNTLLPLGSLIYLLFCTTRYGLRRRKNSGKKEYLRSWGWKNFIEEANTGERGPKFPQWTRIYCTWILPVIILFIFIMGYYDKFFAK